MFIRNNPTIDFDALEEEVNKRIESYRLNLNENELPEYDAARLQNTKLDVTALQPFNVAGGLNQLYSLEDRDFVYFAYNLFLERAPTENEAAVCVERLRSGENKTRIAYELRYCEEGKDKNQNISLRKEFIVYKLIALPVIGRFIDILSIVASLPVLKKVYQATSNHQYRLMELLRADINRKNQRLGELGNKVRVYEHELETLKGRLEDALNIIEKNQKNIKNSTVRLTGLERKQLASPGAEQIHPPGTADTYTDDALYVAFEEQYRGSSDSIRERLGYYLPIVKEVWEAGAIPDKSKIVDVGCGRGEWLKLLQDNNFEAIGIDTNLHNIIQCNEEGLTTLHEDAINWLSKQQDESLGCISAFHVIEHLNFSQLNFFIDHALRCLCPGGLILLETPNPENLLVGTNSFYLDPTHVRPLPPGLMDFLLSYKGFQGVTVHRIHPVADDLIIHEDTEAARRCNLHFYEAQDYAVTATKPRLVS